MFLLYISFIIIYKYFSDHYHGFMLATAIIWWLVSDTDNQQPTFDTEKQILYEHHQCFTKSSMWTRTCDHRKLSLQAARLQVQATTASFAMGKVSLLIRSVRIPLRGVRTKWVSPRANLHALLALVYCPQQQ